MLRLVLRAALLCCFVVGAVASLNNPCLSGQHLLTPDGNFMFHVQDLTNADSDYIVTDDSHEPPYTFSMNVCKAVQCAAGSENTGVCQSWTDGSGQHHKSLGRSDKVTYGFDMLDNDEGML